MSMPRPALTVALVMGLTSAVAACGGAESSQPTHEAVRATTAARATSAKDAPVTAAGTTQAKSPGHAAAKPATTVTPTAAPTAEPTTESATPTGVPTAATTALPTAPSTLHVTDPGPRPASSPAKPAPQPDHGAQSAADFARYYVELLNYAWQKPDPAPLQAHAAPGCATCIPYIEVAKTFAAERSHADRPVVVVASSTANDVLDGASRSVLVSARQLAFRTVGPDGGMRTESAPRDVRFQVVLRPDGDSWTVQDIQPIG